jgi:hypothetical protein
MQSELYDGGLPAPITAEYLSVYEPLELLIFQHLKRCDNSHQHARGDRDICTSILFEIESQKDQADRISLTKQCKIIGRKSDKTKPKSLRQGLLSGEGKVLQNLYSPVRSRPAPPILSFLSGYRVHQGRTAIFPKLYSLMPDRLR